MKNRVFFILLFLCLISSYTTAEEKITIAIMDLQETGVSHLEAVSLTNRIRNEFFYTNRFTIVER